MKNKVFMSFISIMLIACFAFSMCVFAEDYNMDKYSAKTVEFYSNDLTAQRIASFSSFVDDGDNDNYKLSVKYKGDWYELLEVDGYSNVTIYANVSAFKACNQSQVTKVMKNFVEDLEDSGADSDLINQILTDLQELDSSISTIMLPLIFSDTKGDMYNAYQGSSSGLSLPSLSLSSNKSSADSMGSVSVASSSYSAESTAASTKYGFDDEVTFDEEAAEQKLVYTSNVSIETKDMDSALKAIYKMIEDNNGIIQSEDLSNMDTVYRDLDDRYTKRASSGKIYVRIPQQNYTTFINGLYDEEGVLYVTNASKFMENMTDVYYDTQSYLQTLRIEQERLYAFLEQATTIEEMLTIEDRLTEIQYKIEKCMNTLKVIDYDADFAKVTIIITEVIKYTEPPVVKEKTTFFDRLKGYFKDTGEEFLDFLEGFLRLIINVVPYLIFFGIIIFIIVIIIRKYRKKHPKKEKVVSSRETSRETRRVVKKNSDYRRTNESVKDSEESVKEEKLETPSIDQIQD